MADEGSHATGSGPARVTRTGIALVHEGELILPAAGSEAAAETVAADDRTVVHYHFPVEVEVRGSPEPGDPVATVEDALRGVTRALRNA